MFESYLFPIAYAFMAFPVAALFFTLPFLVVQYRRHGYINKVRAFVLYLFLLYLMNAVFLVMLPLPATRHNPPLSAGTMQLVPFNFIQDILKETSVVKGVPSTYLHLLKERAVLQVLFNVLLTVPFGMLVRYYFRFGPLRCLLLSFLLSLFFEVTQLTGIYGIFDHAYRVFDVDDLMTNTLGGIIGFLAAEWLSGLLPRIEHLDKGVDLSAKRVSYTRRGLAFLFDIVICGVLLLICNMLRIPGAYFVSTGLYFMLLPYLTGGCTFGKWLVRIRLSDNPGAHGRSKPGSGRSTDRDRVDGGLGARSVGDTNSGKAYGGLKAGSEAGADSSDRVYRWLKARREDTAGGPVGTTDAGSGSVADHPDQVSTVRISLLPLILRYGLLYWVLFGLNRMLAFSSSDLPGIQRMLLGMCVFAVDLWFFIHLIKHLFQKDSLLFYEKISKTQHKIMWKPSTRADGEKA